MNLPRGHARCFRFDPMEQEPTSGSRFDRVRPTGRQPRPCSATKGAMRSKLTPHWRATGLGQSRQRRTLGQHGHSGVSTVAGAASATSAAAGSPPRKRAPRGRRDRP